MGSLVQAHLYFDILRFRVDICVWFKQFSINTYTIAYNFDVELLIVAY